MKILKFLRYVLIIAAFGGAISYMVYVNNQRNNMRQYQQSVRERNLQELRSREEQRKKEEENADNARYQYQKWSEKYFVAKRNMARISEMANPRAKRKQIENEYNEAREQVGYWGGLREGELEELIEEAKNQNDYNAIERYENELSSLKNELSSLYDDDVLLNEGAD